ncbi:hypothetical protein ACI1US_01215 [Leucobacter sp. BZR 635]
MMRHKFSKLLLGIGLAGVLVAAPAVNPASAAGPGPAPDSGPVIGGTRVELPALPEEAYVAATTGYQHSVALGTSGTAYAWGLNANGRLGNGTTAGETSPVPVSMPEGVKFAKIDAGSRHSLAIAADGSAWSWGAGFNGQLGTGSREDSPIPQRVSAPDGTTFAAVSAGSVVSLGLASDGTLYSWGSNADGQLGVGIPNEDLHGSLAPMKVAAPAGATFTQISAGFSHSLALSSDGKVYAWGGNGYGQLGLGDTAHRDAPTPVGVPDDVRFAEVSAGLLHSLAVTDDGRMFSWGSNADGQLGLLTQPLQELSPVVADGATAAVSTQVRASNTFSLAFSPGGGAYAWGTNADGLEGSPGVTNSPAALPVLLPDGVLPLDVRTDQGFSLVLGDDENVYSWGRNADGQLGAGSTEASPTLQPVPRPVVEVAQVTFGGLPGSALETAGDGTLSVLTPAHAAGPVDVAVEWSIAGIPQPPIVYAQGFTYVPEATAPTISDPAPQSVVAGATATFSVTATGTPTPAVVWEVSHDGGKTWEAATASAGMTPGTDGLTLSVATTADHDGLLFRATATNEAGTVVSGTALLSVTEPAGPDPDPGEGEKPGPGAGGGGTGPGAPGLAASGSPAGGSVLGFGAVLLGLGAMLAAWGAFAARAAKRRG